VRFLEDSAQANKEPASLTKGMLERRAYPFFLFSPQVGIFFYLFLASQSILYEQKARLLEISSDDFSVRRTHVISKFNRPAAGTQADTARKWRKISSSASFSRACPPAFRRQLIAN